MAMSNILTSFFIAVGVAAFLYAKLQKYNGGNTKASLTAAGIVFAILLVVSIMVTNAILT